MTVTQDAANQDAVNQKTEDQSTAGQTVHPHPGIRLERGADGIVTLVMDQDGPVNTMHAEFRAALGAAVDWLEAERESLRGVVVTSAKKTFFAGADLRELVKVTKDDVDEMVRDVEQVKSHLRRLEKLGRPVAAAVNGSALGRPKLTTGGICTLNGC